MGLVEEAIMGPATLTNTNKIEFSSAPHSTLQTHKLATVANMTPVT